MLFPDWLTIAPSVDVADSGNVKNETGTRPHHARRGPRTFRGRIRFAAKLVKVGGSRKGARLNLPMPATMSKGGRRGNFSATVGSCGVH